MQKNIVLSSSNSYGRLAARFAFWGGCVHRRPFDLSPIHDLRIASASLSTVLSESVFTGFTHSSICGRSTLVLEPLSWELNFGIFLFIIFFTGLQHAAGRSVGCGYGHWLSDPVAAEREFRIYPCKTSIPVQAAMCSIGAAIAGLSNFGTGAF